MTNQVELAGRLRIKVHSRAPTTRQVRPAEEVVLPRFPREPPRRPMRRCPRREPNCSGDLGLALTVAGSSGAGPPIARSSACSRPRASAEEGLLREVVDGRPPRSPGSAAKRYGPHQSSGSLARSTVPLPAPALEREAGREGADDRQVHPETRDLRLGSGEDPAVEVPDHHLE